MAIHSRPNVFLVLVLFWLINQAVLWLLPLSTWLHVASSAVLLFGLFYCVRLCLRLSGASLWWLGDGQLLLRFFGGLTTIHDAPSLVHANNYYVCWKMGGELFWVCRTMMSARGFRYLCYGLKKVNRQK